MQCHCDLTLVYDTPFPSCISIPSLAKLCTMAKKWCTQIRKELTMILAMSLMI